MLVATLMCEFANLRNQAEIIPFSDPHVALGSSEPVLLVGWRAVAP
jgi:hypothetical protein